MEITLAKTKTALSRTDFENGTVFSFKDQKPHLYLMETDGIVSLYNNFDKRFYCRVAQISNIGFTAKRMFFGERIETRIYFSDCNIIGTTVSME